MTVRHSAPARSARWSCADRRSCPDTGSAPDETGAAIVDGELRTGDVGVVDEDGWLYLVARAHDMIVASGFKVWPREVEDVLYEHQAVREAAVVVPRTPTAARPSGRTGRCRRGGTPSRTSSSRTADRDLRRTRTRAWKGRRAAQDDHREDPCAATCASAPVDESEGRGMRTIDGFTSWSGPSARSSACCRGAMSRRSASIRSPRGALTDVAVLAVQVGVRVAARSASSSSRDSSARREGGDALTNAWRRSPSRDAPRATRWQRVAASPGRVGRTSPRSSAAVRHRAFGPRRS